MNSYPKKSLTLIELLIAIGLLSVIILAISNIDLFTRFHTISADRRVKLQNEVSYVLDHMTKEISKAIGDVNQSPVSVTTIGVNSVMTVWIDYNKDGKRDSSTDRQIAYAYQGSPDYQIRYYSDYIGSPASYEVLSQKISLFTPPSVTDNYVNVNIAAHWDPDGVPYACGTPDNPGVLMRAKIQMPSVSTH